MSSSKASRGVGVWIFSVIPAGYEAAPALAPPGLAPALFGPDLFVHYSEIQATGYRSLEEGHRVEHEVTPGAKGPQAAQVNVV
ncbi:cold shock domain-containing protein [Streptomyces sp. NPDC001728]|uniref:cold shock domain-containing protein n=1 Tax=Streptomyces sp. NPDC001728 TaxID=3154396 RepID=UPI00333322FA